MLKKENIKDIMLAPQQVSIREFNVLYKSCFQDFKKEYDILVSMNLRVKHF